jgi:hypothetical protein
VASRTHALDRGQPLDTLVCGALAWLDGVDRPRDAESRRGLYDRFGVVCDALSNTVLCAGLRPSGSELAATKLCVSAEAGAPCVLTLAELRDVSRLEGVGSLVSVCENPEVMASAIERFGAARSPLVCISGWPHVAALRLLRALSADGCRLRYHGDFDWDGLRIAAAMIARLGVGLWHYDATAYADAPSGPELGPERGAQELPEPLQALHERMRSRGVAVAEEQVLDVLLDDLAVWRAVEISHGICARSSPTCARTPQPRSATSSASFQMRARHPHATGDRIVARAARPRRGPCRDRRPGDRSLRQRSAARGRVAGMPRSCTRTECRISTPPRSRRRTEP